MSQIDDQIWIGNSNSAQDHQFFKDRGITHVICCAEELKFRPGFVDSSKWHHIPIVDNVEDERTEGFFREGAALLKKWLNEGHKIMVHCFGGVSRSVSVVIAYYILYKGWSYEIAYLHCRQRCYADPHDDFVPILRRMQTLEQALE